LGDKIGDGVGGQINEKEPVTSRVGEEEEDMKVGEMGQFLGEMFFKVYIPFT
jgi:hypothetical protein